MTAAIIIICVIACIIYFYDELKKLGKQLLELYKSPSVRKEKPKPMTSAERTAELKSKFQEILDKRKAEAQANKGVPFSAPHPVNEKSRVGQEITDYERDLLWDSITKRQRVRCINCEVEDMYKGPQGGMSQNWRCPNCGQGINLTIFGNDKNGFRCDNIGVDTSWRR